MPSEYSQLREQKGRGAALLKIRNPGFLSCDPFPGYSLSFTKQHVLLKFSRSPYTKMMALLTDNWFERM
jgi:hypothetical protein